MSALRNDDIYTMGRTEGETQRLQRQAALRASATRQLFEDAGIRSGMNVLDLGSGAGDVAMLAAELAGPTGHVVGVDMNPAILETARRRAQAAGHANVTFVAGDLGEVPLHDAFDAIVGRAILAYLPDPAAVLRQLLPHLRSGGVVAFEQTDFTVPPMAYPPSVLVEQIARWVRAAFASSGAEVMMGMKLHQVYLDAGLEAPRMRVDAPMGGSRAFVEEYAGYMTETCRSLLPAVIKAGIASEEEVGIETLERRLRDELLQQGSVIRGQLRMGAWARKA